MTEPPFSIGIEEEYLLVDRETCALVEAPDGLMEACAAELEGQVSPEFLQCQIEIGTRPCAGVAEAREELRRLREAVSRHAASYGLSPIAASCHPLADWKKQHHTDKERYNDLDRALGSVVRRMLICGMHVHVGLEDDPLRADLLAQTSYFLPHLLALSASSPFWQGEDTKLASYRISVFDNLPRTGLPPQFDSWQDYHRSTEVLIETGVIEDRSRIWWDLRPSSNFPTLEARIMDVQPRMEHALTLAALVQCLMRMLWRLRVRNQRWRLYDRFLIGENRWRAQRYGVSEGLIDFGAAQVVPFPQLVEELMELLQEDAAELKCLTELARAREIAAEGTSADRQRAALAVARDAGADHEGQMRAVVHHLIEEFHADL
ncbi:carboxylate-amine ligase [Mameliella alba]|uniref:carboxylate-amine ligase n=1 Tax=Mameliella alba TaxID=561184 RepID=UPI00088CFCA2|nr:carboxylate-amine ligase [Mameliella alba]OWV50276.1 carboxylate-amine ligase [Mameliella alba]PTR42325.1 carboxylate-amine ligase [Mameliella alba]GGF56850.1 putative glutamate--cysteine ligase 2 [Mameliella alba]SDC06149.1 carboxylate-amine ligase [Mameliella alba]